MDRDDWLRLIRDPKAVKHFAGSPFRVPEAGDRVKVLTGENVGEVFRVITVIGNVYRSDQQVFVDHPSGIPTWYYPWNLEVVL